MLKSLILSFAFLFCIFAAPGTVCAQICQGSLGDPVVNIDFGRGTADYGPPLGNSTNYIYVASKNPGDGYYTIVKTIGGGAWFVTNNHTPNDPDGYMMMVNASYEPGVFYETAVATDLCPNTTYEFSAWVINLLTYSGNKPNLTFSILTMNDQVLSTYNTGNILESPVATWKQYGFLFRTPLNVNRVKIRIVNNGPGGDGNDLALDDITFRPCGTKLNVAIDQMAGQLSKTICEGDNNNHIISASAQGSSTLQYQWQKINGKDWVDIPNETSAQLSVNFQSQPVGIYQYRLVAAEASNFGSPACRTSSPVLTLEVKPLPKLVLSGPKNVCLGGTISLDAGGGDGTYSWTGPNNYSSTAKSIVIENADLNRSGTYKVTITSESGCSASAQIDVMVTAPLAPVTVADPTPYICEGSSVTLQASGGWSTYRWSPAEGLSDASTSNPVASPSKTTLYTVTASNGSCKSTAQVTVSVDQKIIVSAGPNKTIREGQSTILDGSVSGDRISYFWTPGDYLDDPKKLKPVASPVHTMTYVLHVISEDGCPGNTSSVLVNVYQKLVIPNAFTPNGDGVNDVWNIEALETYPEAELKVFNRYGEKVYSAAGSIKSWDGKYKGQDVPVGTYYYIIDTHSGQSLISGSITILR